MSCNRKRWDEDISNFVFGNDTQPDNYSLAQFCEASSPETSNPPTMTSPNPSQLNIDEERLNQDDKRCGSTFTVYPATVYQNARITIQDTDDGDITTQINSQPQSKGGHAFIVTKTGPYGQLYNTLLYIPNPSAVSHQSRWALVNPQNFKQLAISTHHPNGQQELRILVEPEWVNNPGGDQSIVTIDCTQVAKADLSRRILPPDDWNPDLSSLSNPR